MSYRILLVIVLSFLLPFVQPVYSEPTLKFQHIDISSGLPSRTVWDIEQSNNGLVWFGTSNGLVSFDGYHLEEHRALNSQDKSFNANIIRTISISPNGEIFVGTHAGLFQLHKKNQSLRPVPVTFRTGKKLNSLVIFDILVTQTTHMWLATSDGIKLLNKNNSNFSESELLTDDISSPKGRISSLLALSSNEVLIGTAQGLYLFEYNTGRFRQLKYNNSSLNILSLFKRKNADVLIGTNKGIFKLSTHYKLTPYIPELNDKYIFDIAETNNELWLGTQGDGLFYFNKRDGLRNSNYTVDDINSIADSDAYSLFVDSTSVLWVGSFNAGVSYFSPDSKNFKYFSNGSNSLHCLESPTVYSIFEESESAYWLGTQKGAARIETDKKSCTLFKNELSSPPNRLEISSIFQESNLNKEIKIANNFSIDTVNLKKLDFRKDELKSNLGGVKDHHVSSDGTEYVGTFFGVFVKKPNTDRFTPLEFNYTNQRSIFKIASTEKNLYFSSWDGLLTLDDSNRLTRVSWEHRDLINQAIRALAVDLKGRIWVGIDNVGLFAFSDSGKLLFEFRDPKKLSAIKGFSAIEFSEDNSLWISSTKGISHVGWDNKEIVNYTRTDGLADSSYTNGASHKGIDGTLYFGNRKGLTVFNPKEIKKDTQPPKLLLTNFLYFNNVLSRQEFFELLKVNEPVSDIEEITLSYKDYVFGFEFAGLHFSDPERNQYAYQLEGWDREWVFTDSKYRRATYSNLPPGHYNFKFKASNSHGVWNETPKSIRVIVTPPPWATPLAYTLYVIFLFISIYIFVLTRTRVLKNRTVELENSVKLRTSELSQEKLKVEQLLSSKNEEFANLSHEFRTPLTLILGPISQLVIKSRDKALVSKLNIVQRNALRLLRMVDQLLNLETFRVKAITQKSPQAISKTTQLVAEAFADLADEKDITFEIKQIDPVCFDFTPDAIEKIILNLLSNAIKYTKPGGTITISATRTQDKRYLIQVADTGIGIAKDKLEKVFERFNRVMDENSEQVTGSGIGLALVKSLVESHDGSVELESELGQGTTITVTLPIINEVDESQINVHQNDEIIAMELMNVSSSGLHEGSIAQSAETIQSTGKPTVLVIEDNDDMRQYIVESIGQQFNTLMAADGQAGLELAIREVPDLIISDIMMPKLDGYQTTKALREAQITNHIPVVLLTARGDRDSRLKGWEEKADEYITKPFDVEELVIRISNLIEIRNILKRRFSETVFEKTKETLESPEEDSGDLSIVEINTQRLQQEFIEQLNQHIESVYMEAELAVVDIAKAINMSERQFYRKLRSVIDMTPSEYLRRFRLEKSKEILRSGKTANFTAFEVGFSSQAYFSKCFKAQYNLTPRQFVNQK